MLSVCCVDQVFDWYDQVGDGYLKHTQLGDNLHAAQMLQEEHVRFEMQARVSPCCFSDVM